MCIATPQSIVLPAPPAAAAASPNLANALTPYLAAARSLPQQQAARLADALFMQATAMHLFQMHSALPAPTLSEHLTRDRLLAEELTAAGVPPGQPRFEVAPAGTPGASPGAGRAADPTQGWCEDYRTILKLSTVRAQRRCNARSFSNASPEAAACTLAMQRRRSQCSRLVHHELSLAVGVC